MPNPFSGITSIGVTGGEIVTAGMSLVTLVLPIVLVVLGLIFAPKLIGVIKRSFGK